MTDEQPFIPPTVLGVVYWKDHVVGVVDDQARAEAAVAVLREAGIADGDARAWTGEFVTRNHQHFLQNRGTLQRVAALLPSAESEEMNDFVQAAAQGRSIVTVRAAADEEARRAAEVLRQHGARHLIHYRAHTFVDL